MEPCVGLHTGFGACLGFKAFFSALPFLSPSLKSINQSNKQVSCKQRVSMQQIFVDISSPGLPTTLETAREGGNVEGLEGDGGLAEILQ